MVTFASVANGQQSSQQQLSNSSTDAELLELLASSNPVAADNAAAMIITRGERMIGPLMKLRGDKRFFAGVMSQSTGSANLVFVSSGDAKQDKELLKLGKLVTMEVAAVYLISAIYFETMNFAQSPYLRDLSLPKPKQKVGNTPKRIDRAWRATDKWYERFTELGIKKLRASDDYPLKNSRVEFR